MLSHGQPAAAYAYDLAGNLKGMTYGNGVTNRYLYDSLNRLTNLVWNYHSSPLASFAYQLMAGGTRTNLVETNSTSTFNYQWSFDNLYRMTNENIGTIGSEAYSYDPVGNRANRLSGGGLTTQLPSYNYSYNTNDELNLAARTTGTSITNNYDSAGNTVGMTAVMTANSYTYDGGLNQLVEATVNGNLITVVGYDADGNRIEKGISSLDGTGGTQYAMTYYLMDDVNPSGYAQVLEEYQGVWNVNEQNCTTPVTLTRAYEYGTALISQQQFDPNSYLPSTISYYGYDGHGSVRFLMNTNGGITDTYTYDAFGSLIASNMVTQNDFLYYGQQWDPDLALYYNRARYLNTDVGRFWTMDQTEGDNQDPLSLHKYLYAEDDPVNLIDVLGLSAADVTKIYNLYAQKLQAMTDAGQRLNTGGDHTIGWYNNLCGLFGGQEMGCGQQAAEVDAVLVFQKYDVHWDFDIPQIFNPLPHQFVKATSADPNDPTLIIDPWAGTFCEKYPDGSGNLLTVPILDKDEENSIPGPVFSAPSAGGFDFGAGDFGFGGVF